MAVETEETTIDNRTWKLSNKRAEGNSEENENRVGWGIVGVGLIIDLLQVVINLFNLIPIPLVGTVIAGILTFILSCAAVLNLYIYFLTKGINFFEAKRAPSIIVVSLIEIVPILSALPGWTLLVARTVADNRMRAPKTGQVGAESRKSTKLPTRKP